MATESWSLERTGINQLLDHDHSFNLSYWSAVGFPGRESVEPLFGTCSAALQCLSFHPCFLPQLHISRGVQGSWTNIKVCTYLPGAALRITGSRQESDLSLQFSTCWRINNNIFVSESHWVAQCSGIWLLLRILHWCLFKLWPEHPHSSLQTTGTWSNWHFWASSIC